MEKTKKRIDYISKVEDIRLIASGVNAEHRTMMAYLGIATAGECALLDNLVDAPEDDAPEGEEETTE